nr:MAG: hypothetical protein [Bacteriophage sp.]
MEENKMKRLEIIGYSYDWVPEPHEGTKFDKELSEKQNKEMDKLFKSKIAMNCYGQCNYNCSECLKIKNKK